MIYINYELLWMAIYLNIYIYNLTLIISLPKNDDSQPVLSSAADAARPAGRPARPARPRRAWRGRSRLALGTEVAGWVGLENCAVDSNPELDWIGGSKIQDEF